MLRIAPTKSEGYGIPKDDKSSSAGESHPHALREPDVTVSRHPALIIQLPFFL
jgi:hypothetical protein